MTRFKAVFYCLTLAMWIAQCHPLMAAAPASKPATTTHAAPVKPPPAPTARFSLLESATEAESTKITLNGIESDLGNDPVMSAIQTELPILTSEIDARLDESAKLLKANPSLQLLGSQEQDWSAIEKELGQWKQSLHRRTDQLQSEQNLLEQSSDDWKQAQAVCDYYHKWGHAPALVKAAEQPIEKTRDSLRQTTDKLDAAMLQVRSVRLSVDLQAARVLDVLNSTRQARDAAFNRLFMQNAPTLWHVSFRSQGSQGIFQQGMESFDRQWQAVGAYLSRRRGNVAIQMVLLLGLALGLRWIKFRMESWVAEDPELKKPTRVFASPLASALVIALLFSGSIYPQAPRLFWAMMGAAALIPTVIILRRLIDRRWFSMLDALVVFYFLDQLRSIAAVVPELARLLLLLEMLGAFFLLMSFMRSIRLAPISPRACKIIRTFTLVWMIVFLLASMGAVIGFVSLAEMLGNGALASAYLAVVLYACTLILQGVIIIALRSRPLVRLKMVRTYRPVLLGRITRGLDWLAIAAWGLGVLASLSVASLGYEYAEKVLSAQLTFGSLHLSLGDVIKFSVTVWASILLSRFLRFVLEEDVYDRFTLPSGIPYAISKLLNYVVLLIGFFVAVSALGYDMTKFTILAGAFGVGLGFGMQNIVNNFVSGLILLFERPVKVGDVIQMGDTTGVVVHIGIRASILRTHDSSEIIIPNGNLISSQVTNWTLSNRQRGIDFAMKLGADADPTKVIALLKSVAAANPRVSKSPAPEVFLADFGADSFSYKMTAWTDSADQWVQIRSELSVALNRELGKENIAIK